MRTDWAQTAYAHTKLCDELDALMDLTGELQRAQAFGTDQFVMIGRIRQAICDAQGVTNCKWKGANDSGETATGQR